MCCTKGPTTPILVELYRSEMGTVSELTLIAALMGLIYHLFTCSPGSGCLLLGSQDMRNERELKP